MKKSFVFVSLSLVLLLTLLISCEQETKEENIQLKKKINELQAKNDTLKSLIAELQQTDTYYYQMAINCRQNENYEQSNKYLDEMIERFPKSDLIVQTSALTKKNNDDIAQDLYNKAVSASNQKMYEYSDDIIDELIIKFPTANITYKAKELKIQNKIEKKSEVESQSRQNCSLELLAWSWARDASDYWVEAKGQVKNISDRSLRNVEVLVTFYDKNGTFITASDALIEFNPILPGQTSPFRAMETYNPAMAKATIEFKFLMGETIPMFYKP